MHKILACLAAGALGLLSACSSVPNHRTNYAPPSVGKVQAAVSSAQGTNTEAQRRVTSASGHAASTSKRLATAAAQAKTIKEKLVVIAKATEPQPEVHTLVLQVTADVDTLTQELLNAQTDNSALTEDLTDALGQLRTTQLSLEGAQTNAATLQNEITQQTILLNDSNAKLNAAILQGQKDRHNAHVFKWIIIGCAAAIAGLLVFSIFGATALAPPLLYLLLGLPAAVTTFLFFFLG